MSGGRTRMVSALLIAVALSLIGTTSVALQNDSAESRQATEDEWSEVDAFVASELSRR